LTNNFTLYENFGFLNKTGLESIFGAMQATEVPVMDEEGLDFSPELQEVISEFNFQQDELDKPNFNPIEFINQEFPNEQSLVNLDPVLTKLRIKISQYDSDIAKQIRMLSVGGDKASRDLAQAQASILQLFTKIHTIKEKV
jgi:vacuolar protein sorting-associated protein 53